MAIRPIVGIYDMWVWGFGSDGIDSFNNDFKDLGCLLLLAHCFQTVYPHFMGPMNNCNLFLRLLLTMLVSINSYSQNLAAFRHQLHLKYQLTEYFSSDVHHL